MKHLHSLIVILFYFLSLHVSAQNTLLWEISGKRAKEKSYLYGTMHTTDARAFEFNDSLKIVFDKCKAFAMEFTPDKKNMEIVQAEMYLENNKTLKDLYSEDDYEFLSNAVRDVLGMNIKLFERMKPFFLMSMFMQTTMKADKPYFVDKYLYDLAINKGMKTISVEKVSEQIEAIKGSPPEALIEYIKEMNNDDDKMEELIDAYRLQDLSKMLALSEQDTTNKEMMEVLLDKRNHTMAKRIARIVRKQPTFIAVGALHLPGEVGVIRLLEQRGFKVRPIYAPYKGGKS